jgi:hypothetical protein
MRRLLVTAKVPSSPILVILVMKALRSSETSVLTRATRRNAPEDGCLQEITQGSNRGTKEKLTDNKNDYIQTFL